MTNKNWQQPLYAVQDIASGNLMMLDALGVSTFNEPLIPGLTTNIYLSFSQPITDKAVPVIPNNLRAVRVHLSIEDDSDPLDEILGQLQDKKIELPSVSFTAEEMAALSEEISPEIISAIFDPPAPKPQTFSHMVKEIAAVIESYGGVATFSTDDYDQIVVYAGLQQKADDDNTLIPYQDPRAEPMPKYQEPGET